MCTDEIAVRIAAKDADLEAFARLALEDDAARDELVRLLATDSRIMVYYHCYEALALAAEERPALLYPHWDTFAGLLEHANSYHRSAALATLAHLVPADIEARINSLLPAYLARLNDEKLSTAQYCARGCAEIIRHRPDLAERIMPALLAVDATCPYPPKQIELLKADVLDAVEAAYGCVEDRSPLDAFVAACVESASPKTRKRARGMATAIGGPPARD